MILQREKKWGKNPRMLCELMQCNMEHAGKECISLQKKIYALIYSILDSDEAFQKIHY